MNKPPSPCEFPGRSLSSRNSLCQDPANTDPTPLRASPASRTCPSPRSAARAEITGGGPAHAVAIAPTAIGRCDAHSTTWEPRLSHTPSSGVNRWVRISACVSGQRGSEKVSGTVMLLLGPPVGTKRYLLAGQETVPDIFGLTLGEADTLESGTLRRASWR